MVNEGAFDWSVAQAMLATQKASMLKMEAIIANKLKMERLTAKSMQLLAKAPPCAGSSKPSATSSSATASGHPLHGVRHYANQHGYGVRCLSCKVKVFCRTSGEVVITMQDKEATDTGNK